MKRSAKVGLSTENDLEEASATDGENIKVEEVGVGATKVKLGRLNGHATSVEDPEKKVRLNEDHRFIIFKCSKRSPANRSRLRKWKMIVSNHGFDSYNQLPFCCL